MARFHLQRTLPYDADKLWEMVGDVEEYPQFIPWITQLRTYNHDHRDEGKSRFDADVAVGFKMLSERFSTRVSRDAAARTVDLEFIRGPFRKLDGHWRFTPVEGGTRIDFDMDLDIRNPILSALFRANFDRATSLLMHTFEQRAHTLFGPKT